MKLEAIEGGELGVMVPGPPLERGVGGQIGGGKTGGGVLAMSARRCGARRRRARARRVRDQGTTAPVGVGLLVEGRKDGQERPGPGVDEVDRRQIPAGDADRDAGEGAVSGGDLEADAVDGDGAVRAPLLARDLEAKGMAQGLGRRALSADVGTGEVAVERGLPEFVVDAAVVLLLDPRLGREVEELERELGLALEHRHQSPLDLTPEALLFAVLLGGLGERRVVHDREPLEALGGLGRQHGGAVVGEQRPREPRLAMAWLSPWMKNSAVSARYHCRWQQSREQSSRKPTRTGIPSPEAVMTLRELWWKSACQSPWTCATSKDRRSRGTKPGSSSRRRRFRRSHPLSFM